MSNEKLKSHDELKVENRNRTASGIGSLKFYDPKDLVKENRNF